MKNLRLTSVLRTWKLRFLTLFFEGKFHFLATYDLIATLEFNTFFFIFCLFLIEKNKNSTPLIKLMSVILLENKCKK